MTKPLSDEAIARFLTRHTAERLAAGLPEHVEDDAVLDRIVAIVTAGRPAEPTTPER